MIRFKIRGVSFSCNEETGECKISGAGKDVTTHNPIEAFNCFWERAGYILCNEVRDAIEKNGFDRYMGTKRRND